MKHRLAARLAALSAGAILAGGVFLFRAPVARACGCFTPPDPTVPIVQAGERIAFQVEDGVVTAHIQIQYSGSAEEFGWLLPLPSVPTLDVGTDELFTQLIQQTQPLYRLTAEYQGNCPFDPNQGGGSGGDGDSASDDGGDSAPGEGDGPLVVQDSIGPYDYAVLEADSEEPMLNWLEENGFFVPDGTDEAVDPYIRPGAFFLALKLRKGNDVGDIQPVVVKYASDLPMIPIILTGVAADPDMPVMVWVLGEHRAIPRNYFHTEINDAELNWLGFADNYVDVITRAVDEADEHQSFVTEYAGTSDIMLDRIDYEGRFGDLDEMRGIADAINYVEYMTYNGWPAFAPGSFGFFFTAQTLAILQAELPVPAGLLEYLTEQGLSAGDYYNGIRYYVEQLQPEQPELFEDLDLEFDPQALTDQLEERVVLPTRAAGTLFKENSYMTRLFTTMSDDEMTRDPVFSFNPDLPEVSNVHEGRITYYCGIIGDDTPTTTPATLTTENGFELAFPDGTGTNPWTDVNWPISQFIRVDREEGDSETVVDNTAAIQSAIRQRTPDNGGGCTVGGGPGAGGALALGGLGLLLGLGRRRRR
jgi:MYXO-CTERM domain-containing protein